MAKLLYFVASLLFAGMIYAEVDVDPENLGDTIWLYLTENSPAAQCTTDCPDECLQRHLLCVDIPDVEDCSANLAACQAGCDEMCTCYKGCTAKCVARESCEGVPLDEVSDCATRHHMCVIDCNAHCPNNAYTMEMEQVFSGFDQVLKQALSMVPSGSSGQE